jgi:DNA-binding response OmpR family regulator
MKLLVVEDEEMLQSIIAKGLKKYGYAVDKAGDGEEALELFSVNEYDLVVLDLNLPGIDGLEVLKQIRKVNTTVKVIILSARAEIEDRILGLDDGANDYMVKPFDFLELEARIRCLLRQPTVMQEAFVCIREMTVDTKKKSVAINNLPLELTRKEYGILEYLVLHKNSIISAETLIEHVWDSEADMFSNTFKFHMSSLKKKIAELTPNELIRNVRGQGYIVEESELLK